MLNTFSKTTKLFAGLIASVVVIMIIMIAASGNRTPTTATSPHYAADDASADNKVEALKTMTADLLSVENKNNHLEQRLQSLQDSSQQSIAAVKKSLSQQVEQSMQKVAAQSQAQQATLTAQLKESKQSYPINGGANSGNDFVWVSDLSKPTSANVKSADGHQDSVLDFDVGHSSNAAKTASLLHDDSHPFVFNQHKTKQDTVKPMYTIPVNATLTGATLMTPLVGRVPIDGQLPSPYHFKLVLSGKNLTANGIALPGVQGAVMGGVASGDMLGSCARGDIHSITFIFNDGTISTVQANKNNAALGYISSETGNPCLAGTFHSNAALFLGAQMGLSGAAGYANALTSSQYMSGTTPAGGNIRTLIGSANKAAAGQAGSSAAQAAQTWWNRRVQNSFDYVYVPNVDKNTNQSMKVVVNITQQIPINYDKKARKISYENTSKVAQSELD